MWNPVWADLYSKGWGARWPSEDLIRFMETRFKDIPIEERSKIMVLDLGCGLGRNLWYLHDAGFGCVGIDGATIVGSKIVPIFQGDLNNLEMFRDEEFSVVVDVCSMQHNVPEDIKKIVSEVHRVLETGGVFFSIVRAHNDDLNCMGMEVAEDTYTDIILGDLKGKGVTHFFWIKEIYDMLRGFEVISVDREERTVGNADRTIRHFIIVAKKKEG